MNGALEEEYTGIDEESVALVPEALSQSYLWYM